MTDYNMTFSEYKNIFAAAGMGTWRIEQIEGQEPRMLADDTMQELLGLAGKNCSPEETYNEWFSRIKPEAVESVLLSVGKMQQGYVDENTYLWVHPTRGERYVRCGGTAEKVPGGFILRGYHYDVDTMIRTAHQQNEIFEAVSQEYHTVWLVTKADLAMHFIRSSGISTIQNAVNMGLGNANYDRAMKQYVDTYVLEEDRERVAAATGSAAVMRETKNKPLYTVNYHRRDDAGNVAFHQMAFADADDGFILAYRDIDEIMREELDKQAALQDALDAAKAANQEIDAIHLALGSGDWSMDFNEKGEMTACSWSPRFREMLGYSSTADFPDRLESWSDLLHAADKDRVLAHYWDVVNDYSGKKTYNVEYRLSTRDRGERWFRAIGRLTRREDGSPVRFYGIFLDVDEEIRSRLDEQAETDNLISALSSVYVDVILVDLKKGTARPVKLDHVGGSLDHGFYANSGRPYSMKNYVENHVHPDDRRRFAPVLTIEDCREFFSGRNEYSFEYRSVRDGETHYIQIQMVRPDFERDELAIGYKNIDAEEAERLDRINQEHTLLGVIEALSSEYVSVFLLNAEKDTYRTIRANSVGASVTAEYNRADEALRSFVDNFVAPEDRERMYLSCTFSHMAEVVPESGIYSTNYNRMENGEVFHMQMNVARFHADDGSQYFVLGFRDISASIEKELLAQKALQEAYDVANAANHAKSDFLQTMSHDIRTPMNGIIGMTAIAAAHIDDKERVQDSLQKITAASRHLLSLINEVLDMSKIESGKVSLTEENFNLSDLIDNLITMVRPQIAEHEHELKINIRDVRHELVVGDSLHIQQAFVNLMSNAIKYTPNGGTIHLGIREIPCNQARVGCYEFVFQDNGIGMSEEFIRHIFEPFTRAEDGRISKVQGTGLGMPITKNIVNMMGGDIQVESRLNEGSTFTVTIFLQLQGTASGDHTHFADLSVLVADDDEMSMESAVSILEEMGMEAEGVLSGREALESVLARHEDRRDYNAVVLDWKMPGMDGVETARAIRRAVGATVPIIILSAYDWTDIEEEARRAGVNAFVSKPLFKSRLERVFDELIGDHTAAETPDESPMQVLSDMDLSSFRCLLAEDNELNAEIAIEILEETGLTVDHVWDGAEAVEAVTAGEDGKYDIVLMDIQMPKMNGYDATRAIRASGRSYCKSVPIIAMTANAFAEDVQAARTAGMNEHIAKPLDLKVLAEVLAKWLL